MDGKMNCWFYQTTEAYETDRQISTCKDGTILLKHQTRWIVNGISSPGRSFQSFHFFA